MTNLDKAINLYLRGFNNDYIKRRTNISIQSLLKKSLSNGIKYDKSSIIDFQIKYIKDNYCVSDVISAYEYIIETYGYDESIMKKKQIHVLGCGFGNYPKVFKAVLGDSVYNELRNKFWKRKQVKTVNKLYGVDNVFDKKVFSKFVSDDALNEGRIKREKTLMERYGVTDINKHEPFLDKMRESQRSTFLKKYGVDNPMKINEIAKLSAKNRQEAMLEKYGVRNSVQSPELMDKIFKARKRNNTMNTSLPETTMHRELISIFGENDVVYNEIIDARYPYHVDFYVKSRDLFIELNGDSSHCDHWFDIDNINDRHRLESYIENMNRIESETGKSSKYRGMIKTWTITDLEKRNIAKRNNLNYLVFWDGSCRTKNGCRIAKLSDFYSWVEDGCPDSFDWNSKNTY